MSRNTAITSQQKSAIIQKIVNQITGSNAQQLAQIFQNASTRGELAQAYIEYCRALQ